MSEGTLESDPEEGTEPVGDGELEDIIETLGQINTSLSKLWRNHKGLEGAVDRMLELMEAYTPSGPLHWGTLPDEAAADLLERVADFVDFLQEVYLLPGSDFKIKRCWWQHPDVLWQLTALYAAFIDAYNPNEPPSTKQAAFHEHVLWPILHRIRALHSQKECNATEHKQMNIPKAERDPKLKRHIEELRADGDDKESHDGDVDGRDNDADRLQLELVERDNAYVDEPDIEPDNGADYDAGTADPEPDVEPDVE